MQKKYSLLTTNKRPKKAFTEEEDRTIRFVVSTYGSKDWNMIATFVDGRTAKQCRDRYMNYLKPGLTNFEWTQNEDKFLLQLYFKYGPKWAQISTFFYNRNQISIKNRFKFLQKSFSLKQQTIRIDYLNNIVSNKNCSKIQNNTTKKDNNTKNDINDLQRNSSQINNLDFNMMNFNDDEDQAIFNDDIDYEYDDLFSMNMTF